MFGYRGRMKRGVFIAYHFGLAVLAAAGLFAGMIMLRIVSHALGLEPGDDGFRMLMLGGASLFAALVAWSLVALAIKRARDAGLPKRPLGAAVPGVPLADHFLIAPITPERLGDWPFDAVTPLAVVALAAVYLFLLLAPSRPIAPLHAAEDEHRHFAA